MVKKKDITHIQVKIATKERLEVIRDREGYVSMDIVIEKLLNKCGNGKTLWLSILAKSLLN